MSNMFYAASAYIQPLDNWDTSSVKGFSMMFYQASAFNQNLCQWGAYYNDGGGLEANTMAYYAAGGVDYRNIFTYSACSKNASPWGPISADGHWCQSCCTKNFPNNLITLKAALSDYVNQDCGNKDDCAIDQEWGYPINNWCVEQVTNLRGLTYDMPNFNEDINGWTTGQVCVLELCM